MVVRITAGHGGQYCGIVMLAWVWAPKPPEPTVDEFGRTFDRHRYRRVLWRAER